MTCPKSLLSDSNLETEAAFHDDISELINLDAKFLKELQSDPVRLYLKLRGEAQEEIGSKQPSTSLDFGFPPHRHILMRAQKDLEQRLNRKFGEKFKPQILSLITKIKNLLIEINPPYKKTIRFIFNEYLPVLDSILCERHPDLMANAFHKHHAEHLIEPLLAKAPDLMFYFSYAWVDDNFFTATRPALMNIIGINLTGLDDISKPPYADKFHMKTSEFAYHDLGHAEFTSLRDLEYLQKDKKPIERTVWEWEITRIRIQQEIDNAKSDEHLSEAMELIPFELLRERGFQFSLTVLKQELETPKWTNVLNKKLNQGFYDYYGINKEKFKHLDEAREKLVFAVKALKCQDQEQWIRTLRANIVPAKILHTPSLKYGTGRLIQLEIQANQPTLIYTKTKNLSTEVTTIRELISAQINPIDTSPLTENIQYQISKAFNLPGVNSILVKNDKSFWAKFYNGDLKPLSLLDLSITPTSKRILSNIEVFEINQVLGTEERQEEQAYTIRKPSVGYAGTIEIDKSTNPSEIAAKINTLNGQILTLPLSELRVDPLQ